MILLDLWPVKAEKKASKKADNEENVLRTFHYFLEAAAVGLFLSPGPTPEAASKPALHFCSDCARWSPMPINTP